MKRMPVFPSFVLAAVIALVGAFAIGLSLRDTIAQDIATQDHPLNGVWLADTDPEDASNALDVFTFSADGAYIQAESGGFVSLGSWEATGAATANLTIVSYESDDEGTNFGSLKIRASIEVSEDGASFSGQYTLEFIVPDGISAGEAGPGAVTGTRLVVQAPVTTVMTFDELFGGFEGAPEATPTS